MNLGITNWAEVGKFFSVGGIFMALIILCSLVAFTVILFKLLTLSRQRIIPKQLSEEVKKIEPLLAEGNIQKLEELFAKEDSSLARLCAVSFRNAGRTQGEVQEAVQSTAREEIVLMNVGMPVLEVVITIAPLLGLLGTASGLAIVFQDLGDTNDHANIARGIAMALNTTVAGLAVAVPSVIAYSYFARKIETMAARLEVLLGGVVSACHQHMFFKNSTSE